MDIPIADPGPTKDPSMDVPIAADQGPTKDPSMDVPIADPDPGPTKDPSMDVPIAADPGPTKDPSMSMDVPIADPGPTKDPSFPCPQSDTELVHKIAQLLLPGLAAACVDATTGDLFRSTASVAVDLRRDLLDYLLSISQTFIPDALSQPESPDPPDPDFPDLSAPDDVVSYLLEQFVSSRRSLLGRISSWILSDSREDKIDDFVHDLEISNFWLLHRRQSVAETLLKNLDYKNAFHCKMSFDREPDLQAHLPDCPFRAVGCANSGGCQARFCKAHAQRHDDVCPYKVMSCEQGCGDRIVRREMDRHCVTVCRMRMSNCPFYQAGCQSAFALSQLEHHCRECLKSHLVCVLRVGGRDEAAAKELAERMEQSQFRDKLAGALDVRSLTSVVKEVDSKLKKLELDKDKSQNEQAGENA